jgi:hypothetical protein
MMIIIARTTTTTTTATLPIGISTKSLGVDKQPRATNNNDQTQGRSAKSTLNSTTSTLV